MAKKKKESKMAKKISKTLIAIMARAVISGEATLDPEKESDTVDYIPKTYHKEVQAWIDGYYAQREGND